MAHTLRVLYRFTGDEKTARALAEGVALEQSVELPAAAIPPAIAAAGLPGRLESLSYAGEARWNAWISFAPEITGFEITQLLNVLFGNSSLQGSVELLDAVLPPALLAAFPGPRFGIPGLRRMLGVPARPLTCTALKPVGLAPDQLSRLAGRFARAGIDVIKDDHCIANQRFAPFAERVRLCQAAVEAAQQQSGRRVLYAPNLSGSPAMLRERVAIAQEAGVAILMASPMLIGLPVFHELAGLAADADMALIAHPALGGAQRIAPALLLGKLYRLIGADASIFVNHGGRFGVTAEQVRALAAALRDPWGALLPAFPVPSGGMTIERVPEILAFYGSETMLLVSGGLFPDDAGLDARARAFVEAAHAATAVAAQPQSSGGSR